MAKPPSPTTSKDERLREAVRLAEQGDLNLARIAFEQAIALDRRNLDLVYNLALLEEVAGNVDQAAHLYTRILAQQPLHPLAARAFNRLAARFQVSELGELDVAGLMAALRAEGLAHQPVIDLAATWLAEAEPTLAGALGLVGKGQIDELMCGQALIEVCKVDKRSGELLQLVLRKGIVKHAALERALTGARAACLLELTADHLAHRAVMELALALIVQGWNNDHAWAETQAESAALVALTLDRAALLAGDREQTRRFLLTALYRPLDTIITPPLSAEEARRLKPRALRDTIEPHIQTLTRQRMAAAAIAGLRALTDATSLKVAGQYERAPYPRWHSLQVSAAGSLKRSIELLFPRERLVFMDGAFDVLIAGCGTGQQALQAASAYGPAARLLAMDLSRASLGYAADMAAQHKVSNVEFLHGDILDCRHMERSFDIIESVGVLHHMVDWRAGWRALLDRLKPGGLMYIGLYSALSRRNILALRAQPDYPGPGCGDTAARQFRRKLLLRDDAMPGGELKASRDFYALAAFRDLTLHESEAHVTSADIADFLDTHNLVFRGFTLDAEITAEYLAAAPGRRLPGTLADWAAFEDAHPRTFDAMYRFWVERRG